MRNLFLTTILSLCFVSSVHAALDFAAKSDRDYYWNTLVNRHFFSATDADLGSENIARVARTLCDKDLSVADEGRAQKHYYEAAATLVLGIDDDALEWLDNVMKKFSKELFDAWPWTTDHPVSGVIEGLPHTPDKSTNRQPYSSPSVASCASVATTASVREQIEAYDMDFVRRVRDGNPELNSRGILALLPSEWVLEEARISAGRAKIRASANSRNKKRGPLSRISEASYPMSDAGGNREGDLATLNEGVTTPFLGAGNNRDTSYGATGADNPVPQKGSCPCVIL